MKKAWFKKPEEIKVGVIGYGGAFNMGKKHLEEVRQAGMRPWAVCDVNPERLAVAQQDFPGIQTYRDLDQMLRESEVDLVVHITPHNLHYPLALKCLKAGRHVVTEKPFVLRTSEADRLIAEARKRGLVVSTYHNRHWDGCILEAVRQIKKKKVIGEVFRVECHMGGYGMPGEWWRSSKSISGGVLYDWGVHLLEYALQILEPAKIVEVTGFAKTGYWKEKVSRRHPWRDDLNEDDAAAVVRFDNGAMLYLNISSLRSWARPGQVEFMGTEGTFVLDFRQWTLRKPSRVKDEWGRYQIQETSGPNPPDQGYMFYRNLARHLTGQEELIITPEWARRPIHILDLADRSARLGRTLRAKYG